MSTSMESIIKCVFIILISLCSVSNSYKILMMCQAPTRSHSNLCKAVTDILHERGHEVTLIGPFPSEKPKYREIVVHEISEAKEKSNFSGFHLSGMSSNQKLAFLNVFMTLMSDAVFKNVEVQKLLSDDTEKFDAYILEYIMNENLLGFGVRYNCPTIILSPMNMMYWLNKMIDNPTSLATVPNLFLAYSSNMNIWQRTINTVATSLQDLFGWYLIDPVLEMLYNKYFPKESGQVPYNQLKYTISMTLMNSHPSFGVVRPFLPNIIEIGGYHVGEPEKLPEDLKHIMDTAKNGVVFFSMGSNLKSSEMKSKTIDAILKGLSSINETVLWKFEEDLPNKPDNVLIRKWLPQTGILNHPNVKLFITHGGLLSCTEAVHYGVPLLTIPIFGDQYHNMATIIENGYGFSLDFENVTEESFKWALNEALTNKKYAENSKRVHKLYHDRPVKPRDLLGFQVEHVIRTKGAKHLAPPRLSQYSQLLLDVALVILVPVSIILYLIMLCCRMFYKKMVGLKKVKQS